MRRRAITYITRGDEVVVFTHRPFTRRPEDVGESGLQVPAGTVRDGEPPSEAAVREAYEETGLDVRLVRHLGVRAAADHERHFFHLELAGAAPEAWDHDEKSDGPETQYTFSLFWLPIRRARHALDFGLGDYLGCPYDDPLRDGADTTPTPEQDLR